MEAIFSSKLYKTSTRKEKIAAALADPVNQELVQQLDEYLKQPDDVADALDESYEDSIVEPVEDEEFIDEFAEDEEATETKPSDIDKTSDKHSLELENETKEGDVDDEVKEEPEGFHAPNKSDAKKYEEEVEESTKIHGATALYTPAVESSCCDKLQIDVTEIKGTLDLREDTHGVSRIIVKDNELWIHYQDSINLNSVMEPVIYVLNAAGYTHFEFNRLARSSNAIVFEITCLPEPMKSITEDQKDD